MSAYDHFSAVLLRVRGAQAVQNAAEQNSVRVGIPLIGTVTLPPAEQLAYVGGIVLLATLEIIEWPVGIALIAGRILAGASSNKVVQDFGHALEEA